MVPCSCKALFCGWYTQSKAVWLAGVCQRQPESCQQKAKLAKLCAGKHPKSGAQLEDVTRTGSGVYRLLGGAPAEAAVPAEEGVDVDRAIEDEQEFLAECYVLGGVADGPEGDHGDPWE